MSSDRKSNPDEEKAAKAAEKARRKAEFEAKRLAELKNKNKVPAGDAIVSKADQKKQRRQLQEQQRAAKSTTQEKVLPVKVKDVPDGTPALVPKTADRRPVTDVADPLPQKLTILTLDEVRTSLFPQIPVRCENIEDLTQGLGVKGEVIHSAIIKAGVRMNLRTITGSTTRSLGLMVGLKAMIADYGTPAGKAMDRHLPEHMDRSMDFLNKCRPLTTGMR